MPAGSLRFNSNATRYAGDLAAHLGGDAPRFAAERVDGKKRSEETSVSLAAG
jgi:hypothetical protein